jgi:hypothetical protein
MLAIDGAFDDAAERLDSVRATLAVLSGPDLTKGLDARRHAAWSGQKASVYVWIGACLEAFVKSFLTKLLHDVAATHPSYGDLKPELLSICGGAEFERLHQVRRLDKWRDRVSVLQRVTNGSAAVFAATQVPVDGRTIEPKHLEIAWLVYGLPGDPFPGPIQKMALLDISRGRNQVAHGELTPEQLGRSKTPADLVRLVTLAEDIVQHVYVSGVQYVETAGFRR